MGNFQCCVFFFLLCPDIFLSILFSHTKENPPVVIWIILRRCRCLRKSYVLAWRLQIDELTRIWDEDSGLTKTWLWHLLGGIAYSSSYFLIDSGLTKTWLWHLLGEIAYSSSYFLIVNISTDLFSFLSFLSWHDSSSYVAVCTCVCAVLVNWTLDCWVNTQINKNKTKNLNEINYCNLILEYFRSYNFNNMLQSGLNYYAQYYCRQQTTSK